MKKTILVLALAFVAFVAVGSVIDPAAHTGDNKSRVYYFVHPYVAYRTYTVAPVVYYPRYYATPVYPVYPVYRVYPVYTYQYWYNRFSAPKQPAQQVLQGSGTDVKVERPADIKK
jgi:hypothetical protein